MKLQWYDDKTAKWLTLDHTQHTDLDAKMKYRIFEAGRINIVFLGDMWDPTIMEDIKNLSYWAGYHGAAYTDYLDTDQYHNGRSDWTGE